MKIIFPVPIYQKFRAYIEGMKSHEISGLGKIKKIGEEIWIEDVQIFNQRVTPVETVLDRRELGRFYDQLVQNGEDLLDWKLWWHSHANMEVFFSGTDLRTIEDFDNDTQSDNWMLSIVGNLKGDLLAQIDIYSPIRCTMPDLSWEISYENRDIKLNAIDEITEKVKIGEIPQRKKTEIDFSKRPILLPYSKPISIYETNSMSTIINGEEN